jgi:hypothetical protein
MFCLQLTGELTVSIDPATESGWRPVTKQDLIDIIDSGKPLSARFRDTEGGEWKEDLLVGYRTISGRLWYIKPMGTNWELCEVKTAVLRDPKFSDLENGPIECIIYPDGEHEVPRKGVLVGMIQRPTKKNATGIEYHVKYSDDASDLPSRSRWHVKISVPE